MELFAFLVCVTLVSASSSLTDSELKKDLRSLWKQHEKSEELHEEYRKNEAHKNKNSKEYQKSEEIHEEYRKNEDHKFREELNQYWEDYKNNYLAKTKAKINNDHAREVWEQRYGRIEKHNSNPNATFKLGINAFSYIQHDEFVKHYNGFQSSRSENETSAENDNSEKWTDPYENDPNDTIDGTEVDWRDEGIINPVKNQRHCGSCWAFASTGVMEAHYAMKYNKNISLSEQNLLDCSRPEGTKGCHGGSMDKAFDYIIKSKGLMSEKDYPYEEDDDQSCKFNEDDIAASVKHYVNLPKGDEKALMKTVKKIGPVAVAIDASHETFQDYQGGVYQEEECNPKHTNHAMLVVGYGTDDGIPYWLIKNSWGTTWGIDGYMKLLRNKDNHCGIATEANYPVV